MILNDMFDTEKDNIFTRFIILFKFTMLFTLSSDIYDKRVIMLTGFEKETKDLTEYEEDVLLPLMIQGFENHVGADSCKLHLYRC